MADLDIEETNRIRAALGLPALPVPGGPTFKSARRSRSGSGSGSDSYSSSEEEEEEEAGSTLESREALGFENWKKLEDERAQQVRREAQKQAIRKARDTALRGKQLQGKTLGDAEDEDVSTLEYLKRFKKRQKHIEKEREKAKRIAEELAERDKAAMQYTEKDLAGLKVVHELEEFGESGEQILTLKDATIDENEEEGDELENTEIREKEKLEERLRLKRRRPVYDPNDTADSGERSILAQYDEVIDGKNQKTKSNRFILDGEGATQETRDAMKQSVSEKLQKQNVNLDLVKKDVPVSDYVDISEIKIRKPSKKKKSRRSKAVDDDDIFPTSTTNDSMDIDGNSAAANKAAAAALKRKLDNTSFIDDDDLQASLATTRRLALKKQRHMRPEDLARRIRREDEEASGTPDSDYKMDGTNSDDDDEPGLIIDETSEFIANLQKPSVPEQRGRRSVSTHPTLVPEEASAKIDEEGVDEDVAMRSATASPSPRSSRAASAAPDLPTTGLDDETAIATGMGATLNMLRSRGVLQSDPAKSSELAETQRKYATFLAEKAVREAEFESRARAQRERDRQSGKLSHMSAREREEHARWENKSRDLAESRQLADIFNKAYKPNVELKYVDEFGRHMDQKEAFKHLSHQFHGKGSGKGKMEKRLKKIEEERKMEAKSALDDSVRSGMDGAAGETARRKGQAGVRLA